MSQNNDSANGLTIVDKTQADSGEFDKRNSQIYNIPSLSERKERFNLMLQEELQSDLLAKSNELEHVRSKMSDVNLECNALAKEIWGKEYEMFSIHTQLVDYKNKAERLQEDVDVLEEDVALLKDQLSDAVGLEKLCFNELGKNEVFRDDIGDILLGDSPDSKKLEAIEVLLTTVEVPCMLNM